MSLARHLTALGAISRHALSHSLDSLMGMFTVGEGKIDSERENFFFVKATVREEEGKVVAEAQATFSVTERQ